MDDKNEFIERLKNKEVAHRDQVDAESERKQRQQLAEQKILTTAPNEFKRMPKIFRFRIIHSTSSTAMACFITPKIRKKASRKSGVF